MIVVAKVGTSSITGADGSLRPAAMAKVADEIVELRAAGHVVVLVSSGAIAAGLPELGMSALDRPRDPSVLQAVSAVGQTLLVGAFREAFAGRAVVGQVLLSPLDFMVREQYLHARETLATLGELGVVPVINENDAVADDEIRFGDNDRIAALVAQLVGADVLVLLTDAAGVFTADPRRDETASLIEEILEVDQVLEAAAGGAGSTRGSGGMATKLAAAKLAAWSGVRTVIAAADRPNVLPEAVAGAAGVGTTVQPGPARLSARKVWIAFGVASAGRLVVDAGARRALEERGASLLAAGVRDVVGSFEAEASVEVADEAGEVFAKGLVRLGSAAIDAGRGESGLIVIHRDDLVVNLP